VVAGPAALADAVRASPDAVVLVDADGRVAFANDAVERLFGHPPADLVDDPVDRLFPDRPTESDGVDGRLFDAAGEDPGERADLRLVGERRDGEELQLSASVATCEAEDEQLAAVTLRDVTDRVDYRRTLERNNEQLERFASIVSHDLRDPLNTARAQVTLARETGEEVYLDELEEIHDRMAEIIEDVLTLTKQDGSDLDPEVVDLAEITDEAWATAGDERATLALGDLGWIRADRRRLRTVLENLLGNAVRHAGPSVSVRVEALSDGFAVADDGPGIPADRREEALEYGYTTETDGTGLGLSIVAGVAEAHGWELSVEESASGGARFALTGADVDHGPERGH
jgi:PAS domain S-box-containing protein